MANGQKTLGFPRMVPEANPTPATTPTPVSGGPASLVWRFTFRAPAGEPESRNIQRFRLLLKHALRTRQLKCIAVETMTMGPCGQAVPK